MKRLCTAFIAFIIVAAPAMATTIPQVSMEQLYAEADVVAVVLVESGELVSSNGQFCGARYRAKVLVPIKGEIEEGCTLTFGYFTGTGVGRELLIFLTVSSREFSPKMSTFTIAGVQRDQQDYCETVDFGHLEMMEGYGTMEVSWTTKFNYKDAVLFKDEWVPPPDHLEKAVAEPGDNEILSERSWVRVEDVISYLKGLQRGNRAVGRPN